MSDSEQQQLHVPYREYNSNNITCNPPATLTETDALVDLSVTPGSASSNVVLTNGEPVALIPDVEFAPSLSAELPATIDSPGIDRESQPLLGRMDLEITYNRFPGMLFMHIS